MEKLIFLGLAIPILAFVLYLGATAIMKGFSAKEANRVEKEQENNNFSTSNDFSISIHCFTLSNVSGSKSNPLRS